MHLTIQEFEMARKTYYRAVLICGVRMEEGVGKSVLDATKMAMAQWMNKYRNKKTRKIRTPKMKTDKDRFPIGDTQEPLDE